MTQTAYDLKEFYASPMGGVVRRAVLSAIQTLWPDPRGADVCVFGFGPPYMAAFEGAERFVMLMPPEQGAYPFPEEEKNLVAVSTRTQLPLATNSLDGVVLVHSLEHTNAVDAHLDEIWRVLKSNGRLIIVVPNRLGFWSRVDWSPFGQGTPYSVYQINRHLRDALFIPERHLPVLYAIPSRARLFLKLAPLFEKYGVYVLPSLAGLHVIEARKQVYAGLALPVRQSQRGMIRGGRAITVPVAAPSTTISTGQ